MFIDTHSHLYAEYYPEDFDAVVSRAVAAEVTQMILPCVNAGSLAYLETAVNAYPQYLFPLVGLHPSDVNEHYRDDLAVMLPWLEKENVIGVGEIGLDFYHDRDFVTEQLDAFETQLGWAVEHQFPLSLHIRNAYDEAMPILQNFDKYHLKGILHCFSGGIREAEKGIEMGYKLGIGGVVTFKNNKLQDLVKEVGLQHIVLETDAPFLAPTPHRGTPNESAYVPLIAEKLSDIFEVPVSEVARITTENAWQIFDKLPKIQSR